MNGKRKVLIFGVLIVMVIAVGGIAFYYWFNNTYYVSTEDAKVAGDIARAVPQISAKLVEVNIKEGDEVKKDQKLARQDTMGVDDARIETSVIRAPISGIVIKEQGSVGEVVAPGQTVAMLVDPSKLYVSANIEETKLSKMKVGQPVDINIDQYKGAKFVGKVLSIGQASAATFSLLPASSGSTFTKVVQKVPVKIELDAGSYKLLPGTNAVIKIHVK